MQTDTDTFKYSGGDKKGKTVTFDDGSVLTQKGFSFTYEDAEGNPLDLNIKSGLKNRVDESKNKALREVVGGIKADFTEDIFDEFGGREGDLVSGFLADEAAKAKRLQDKDKDAFYGKDADSTGKITSGKNKGKFSQSYIDQQNRLATKTGDGVLADLQAAYQDPLGGLDDIGRAILDGSLFTPKKGQLFYQGGDDTPSAPTDTYTDMGTIPDELQFPAMDSALSSITQSDLPPAGVPLGPEDFAPYPYQPYDAGEFVNANVSDISGIPIDPSSGVLPSSDLGRLLSGDPQIVDDVIKLLAIDPEKTKSDLLSTATTTLGPDRLREADMDGSGEVYQDAILRGGSGSSLSPSAVGTDDSGFTSGVSPSSILGQIVGGDIDLGEQVESLLNLQDLPENVQGLPPSLLQRFRDAQPEGALKEGALDNILRNIDFTSYIPPASQGDVQPKPLDALGNLIENIGERDLPSFLQPYDSAIGFDDPVTIGEAISNLNPFDAAEANPAVASAALKFTKNIVNDNLGKAAAVTGGALATVPLMQRVDEFIRESLGISDAAIGTIPENQKLEFTANQTGVPLAELNATIQNEAMSENPNINISGSIAPSISALQGLTAPNVDTSLPTVGLSAASIPYDAGEFAMPVDRSGNPYAVFDPATGIAIPYSSADAAQGANILAGDNLGVGTGDALSAIEAELGTTDESDRFATATGTTIGRTGDEAKDLKAISSITNLDNVLDIGANTGVNTQPVVEANVIDAAIADLTGDDTTLPPPLPPVVVDEDPVVVNPPVEKEVVVEEDPVVEEDTPITIPPSGGDSKKSKQERRDYSRMREILEQRARAPRGTAPGLGYKPVEGISNTLNKAADSFLDALRFG